METYIPISQLNDFTFCPRSIYFHQLYQNYDNTLFYSQVQIDGQTAHKSIDQHRYSTQKNILQGLTVYSHRFQLGGKIDTYHLDTQTLRERKKQVVRIYDGYIYQVYAQYYALTEMGYPVKKIVIYSMDDNKSYPIPLPDQDPDKREAFIKLVEEMKHFNLSQPFKISLEKCKRCIYNELCDHVESA